MTTIFLLILTIAKVPLDAFLLYKYYQWFFLPVFPNIVIEKWPFYGLMVFFTLLRITYFTHTVKREDVETDNDPQYLLKKFIYLCVLTCIGFVIAFICKSFIYG